jgi:hypothetical protein
MAQDIGTLPFEQSPPTCPPSRLGRSKQNLRLFSVVTSGCGRW